MIGARPESVKFFRAETLAASGAPGTIVADDMSVACGSGAVRILQAQRPGRNAMSGGELLRGAKLTPGAAFTRSGAPPSTRQV